MLQHICLLPCMCVHTSSLLQQREGEGNTVEEMGGEGEDRKGETERQRQRHSSRENMNKCVWMNMYVQALG